MLKSCVFSGYYIGILSICFISISGWAQADSASMDERKADKHEMLENDELNRMNLEELLMLVVTTSKRETKLEDTATAITVITAEDIRRSGLLHISEILRRVAGVNISTFSACQRDVAARAPPSGLENNVLILVNGKSRNIEFIGNIPIGALDVLIEEIKQIEIIKGPGSSLYGDRALHLVVNVITYKPEEIDGLHIGTRLSLKPYEPGHYGSVLYGKRFDNGLAMKLAAKYQTVAEWTDSDFERDEYIGMAGNNNSFIISHAVGELSYNFAKGHKVFARLGGLYSPHADIAAFGMPMHRTCFLANADIEYIFQDLSIKLSGRYSMLGSKSYINFKPFSSDSLDFSLEGNYTLSIGDNLTGIAGLETKAQTVKSSLVKEDPSNFISQNFIGPLWKVSPFMQVEYNPFDPFTLIAGFRFDFSQLGGSKLSLKSSLTFRPAKNHTIFFAFSPLLSHALRSVIRDDDKLSIATAFSNPRLIEVYAITPVDTIDLGGKTMTINYIGAGKGALKPNLVDYWELGYRVRLGKLQGEINLFLYEHENFLHGNQITGSPFMLNGTNIGISFYGNDDDGILGYGGEIELRYPLTSWLSGYVNYAFTKLSIYKIKGFEPREDFLFEWKSPNAGAPMHKASSGARFSYNDIEVDCNLHFVDTYYFQHTDAATQAVTVHEIERYFLLNGRIAYHFLDNKAELALVIYNAFAPLSESARRLPIDEDGDGNPDRFVLAADQPGAHAHFGEIPELGAYFFIKFHI